ncbi:hypothetical protein [Pseudomonas sp. MWU12-2323]|uniref:hypothetical protein n=1 Tax=Pseudomonas sp. MWU12-2323 TaxID=2651296 RepID=UPI0015B5A3BA|nr:hypothetical protein [Pseudomonas sp. MWU12-2323]
MSLELDNLHLARNANPEHFRTLVGYEWIYRKFWGVLSQVGKFWHCNEWASFQGIYRTGLVHWQVCEISAFDRPRPTNECEFLSQLLPADAAKGIMNTCFPFVGVLSPEIGFAIWAD